MDIRECYAELGGNYDAVLARLCSAKIIEKFIVKFPGDDSYGLLCRSLAEEDYETAFRAAHTLKGVCQNLGLDRLYKSSAAITEALRNGVSGDINSMLETVTEDYKITVSAIEKLGV